MYQDAPVTLSSMEAESTTAESQVSSGETMTDSDKMTTGTNTTGSMNNGTTTGFSGMDANSTMVP